MDKEAWILGGILLFAGYGLARSLTSCSPLVRPGSKLYLVGDSLAVGMDRYFRKLAASKGAGYDSSVKSGTAAFQWVAPGSGLAAKLAAFSPDVVLVSLGTNDSYGNRTAEQHRASIQQLIAMIRSVGAEPFWILPPKLPWSQTYSNLVRDEGIQVFESEQIDIPQGPDKIHPTGAGYAGWAGLVWQSITCGETEQLSGPPPNIKIRPVRPTRFMRLAKPRPTGVFSKVRRA